MKHIIKILAAVTALCAAPVAEAQYYEIASQVPSLLSPALSGSLNYKGYVEASGLAGMGRNRANFLGVSTTQGFTYSSWFFMGAGMGVDVVIAPEYSLPSGGTDGWYPESSRTKTMIPLFSDFRFSIAAGAGTSAFIDIKAGAAWLIGSSYLRLSDSYISNSAQFYLRPTLGMRIPVDGTHPSRSVTLGITYQLLTSDNNYSYYPNGKSATLQNLGVTVGYEW